jgi:polyisoprenoid-binding protein YceI
MRVTRALRRRWKAATFGTIVVLAALVVGVPYFYIHVIEGPAPAPLSLSTTPTGQATAPTGTTSKDISGTYHVATGSTAGYRVNEVLAGQHATAVGRTSQVSGSMKIVGHRVTAAHFTVDMASVTSDRSQRDDQFRGRIMDVADFPTGAFTLTKPIVLTTVPSLDTVVTEQATGDLTLHGTTRPVTLSLHAERTSAGIDVTGTTTISYGQFGIDNPSFGGFVSVGSSGAFEVLLHLQRQ